MKIKLMVLIVWIVFYGYGCQNAPMTGEKVYEDFIEATGGKEAYGKIRNSVIQSTWELEGIKIKITSYYSIPNLSYSIFEPKYGKIENGFDGEVAWEISPKGARIIEGNEMWMTKNFSRIDFQLKYQNILKEIKLEGEEFFKGQPCYVITMIPKQGPSITSYYSKKSKLHIQTNVTYKSSKGKVSYSDYSLKYKKFMGILMAIEYKFISEGKEFTCTTESIKFNVDIPKDRFKLPEAIRALLKK